MRPAAPAVALAVALIVAMIVPLGGCAEMRAPPPASRIPAVLAPASVDPVQQMTADAAAAFVDGGRSLVGQPARMARATAQVELVAVEIERDPRWAPLPRSVGFELRSARLELRAALGTRAGADPDAVVRALTAAHLALSRGDTAAAAAALDPALFEPGGNVVLARLASPGALPQTRIATALAQSEITGMAGSRLGGMVGALDPNAILLDQRPGVRFGM